MDFISYHVFNVVLFILFKMSVNKCNYLKILCISFGDNGYSGVISVYNMKGGGQQNRHVFALIKYYDYNENNRHYFLKSDRSKCPPCNHPPPNDTTE